jgi:LPS-assembly protein
MADLDHRPPLYLAGIARATHKRQMALAWLAASALGCCAALAGAEETSTAHARLDWVPKQQLPAELQTQLPTSCCGAYVSPFRAAADAPPLEQTDITANAAKASASGGQTVTLEGDVELRQGSRLLRTQRAELDNASGELTLIEQVTIREDGLLILADRAQMQRNSGDASIDNAEFVLHESRLHGHARKLQKFGDRLLTLTDGSFTTCEPDAEFWRLEASQVKVHTERGYGTAKHARLLIKDVPVFYVPYMAFPVNDERKSGLLFPSVSSSSRNGLEFAQPIYWNIAPTLDATFEPHYMEERGTLVKAQARHLSPFFYTELSGGYLANDKGGSAGGTGTPSHQGDDRWLINLTQTGGKRSRLKTRIDYTDVSDVDYLRDISNSDVDVSRQSRLSKFGEISYSGNAWTLGANAREVRYLNESKQEPYKQVPHLFASANLNWGDWQLALDNHYTRFALTEHYTRPTEQLVVGERLNTNYGLTWHKRWPWGYFKPRVGIKSLSYQLQQADVNAAQQPPAEATYSHSPSLLVPQGSIDTGLFFERFGNLGGTEFMQTLEPRLRYFYSDYEDHSALYSPLNNRNRPLNFDTRYIAFDYYQLFRSTRFSGDDRIDDANQLSAGLTSRFISPTTGIEHLALSVGQIYRFSTPRVTLNPAYQPEQERYAQSELAGRIAARAGDYLQVSGDVLYDQHQNAVSNAGARIAYSDAAGRLLSLTYTYKRNEPSPANTARRSRNQLDVGAFVPVNNSWSVIARAHYDLTYEQELDLFAGLEYNDCCYRVRVLWRQWLDFNYNAGDTLDTIASDDYDRGFFIDLQLKGLASISERVGNLLSKTILGYDEREQHLR